MAVRTRPFLVFSSVGQQSCHALWMQGEGNFDVALVDYEPAGSCLPDPRVRLWHRSGTKWPNLEFTPYGFTTDVLQYQGWVQALNTDGADEPGKEILNPVAVTIFGGLISATLLDGLLTPVLFLLFGRKPLERLTSSEGERAHAEAF